MEILLRCAALCICAAVTALLLRRSTPEFALLLFLGAVLLICALLDAPLRTFLAFAERLFAMTGLSQVVFAPLFKAMAIALVVRVGSAICTDAGAASLAVMLEIAGTVCAIVVAVPLMEAVLTMLEGWI